MLEGLCCSYTHLNLCCDEANNGAMLSRKQKGKAFQAKYGQLPNAMAALGYDSYMIIRDAIERAGSDDPQAIRDALAATKDFPAVTGNTTLNEHGDAVKDAVILQVQNGEFRYLTTVPAK